MPTNAPPVDQLTLNDLVPGERPPPEALGMEHVIPGTFRPEPEDLTWSDSIPVLGVPPNASISNVPMAPSKGIVQGALDIGKTALTKVFVDPFRGPTEEQALVDAMGRMYADPEAAKEMFDESGNVRTVGQGAGQAVMRGLDQLQQTGYALGMWGGDIVGAKDFSERMLKGVKVNEEEIKANPPAYGRFADIGKGIPSGPEGLPTRIRQFRGWLMESIGEQVPNLVLTFGSGTLSGMLARKLIARGVEKAVVQKALEAAANKIALAEAGGVAASAIAQETGSIYQSMVESGFRGPQAALAAALGGVVAGSLESIVPVLTLRRMGGAPIKSPIDAIIRSTMGEAFMERGLVRLGLPGFESMLTEGSTEWLQTAIEQAALLSQDPKAQGAFWDQLLKAYELQMERNEAFAKGAAVGGGLGGLSTTVETARNKIKSVSGRRAFELGVQAAMAKFNQGTPTRVMTKQGTQITVPVFPSALGRPTMLAPLPGVQGTALINQAAAMGLNRTAAVLSGNPMPPIDLTGPGLQDALAPQAPPVTPAQAAARAVVSGMTPEPEPITPGAPVTPSPKVQPAPTETTVSPPPIPEAPGVSESTTTPGAAPAPEITTSPVDEKAPADAAYRFETLKSNLTRLFPHLTNIEVVENGEQFPEDIKRQILARGHTLNAVDAFYWNGRIIFNASKFPTGNPNLVYEKVVHEVAIHLGLRRALGQKKFNRLVKGVWKNLTPTDRAEIAVRNKILPQDILQIGEEWIAYEAERVVSDGRTNGLWVKIAAAFRAGLRTLGFRMKLSDVEIARLIAKGFRAVEQGPGTAAGRPVGLESVTRFSARSKVPPGAKTVDEESFGTGSDFWMTPYGTLFRLERGEYHESWAVRHSAEIFDQPITDPTAAFNALMRAGWTRVVATRYTIYADRTLQGGDLREDVPPSGPARDLGLASPAAYQALEDIAIKTGLPVKNDAGRTIVTAPTYPPGHPLSETGEIRFSFADVRKAKLDGIREYVPETKGAGIAGSFEAVKEMLYREAALLSDLIPPGTSWWQPKENQSLIEYLRRYYSPEGLALLRQAFAGDKAPAYVKNIVQWAWIKEELTALASGNTDPNLGLLFLSGNRKTGGVSLDFGLGTCLPSENCSVCYAKSGSNPITLAVARTRHSIVSALHPEKVGARIADYIKTQPKGELPFLRVNGSGDTTFQWQADIVNKIIKSIDRPVHIFSRSHVSRAPGTIGLDSISNGQFDPGDVENGVAVYKMGSIDAQLMDEFGIDFLRENLEKRGIINCYLVKDTNDIPRMLELRRQGVYFVMHINTTKKVIRALKDAGLLATQENLAKDPGLVSPACPCALETGPFLNGCATCLVGGGPCFAMGSQIAMSENGVLTPIKFLMDGKVVPPRGRLVEMSRVGIPREEAAMTAEVAARAYEMAAKEIPGKIAKAEREETGFTINNPRDKTPILECRTEDDFDDALDIADQWMAYANGLRELVRNFREGSAWERLLAKKQLEIIKEEQRAQTDVQKAAERAAQNVVRTSVSAGDETVPEPVGQANPGSIGPVASTVVPGSGEDLPEHDEAYATRFSTTPLTIANADMQTVLRNAGMPGVAEMLGITESKRDQDLLKAVQTKMAADHSWIDRILDREEKKPGLITDEEALALDFWTLQLRTAFEDEANKAEEFEKQGRPDYAATHRSNAEFWSKPLQRVAEVTKKSGTEQGRAFRARQLALNWDFTLSSLINKKREALGWRDLTEEEMADLAKTAREYKNLSDRLEAENKKLRERDVDAEIAAAKAELDAINPQVLEYAKEWVADLQNRAKNAKDRFKVKWQQLFPQSPLRTSAEPSGGTPTLPDDLLRELAIIGAAKLAANITDPTAWESAMVEETGEVVRPYLPAARAAAEAYFAERLAAGRAEARARRAPRRVPTAPAAPREPTVEERIAITKQKIRTVADKQKGSTEPIKTAEDDLYYAVQELVRELVEQDPLIQREDLVTAVHEILLDTYPDMSREEAMDAISGRGRIRTPNPEAIATRIRDLKAQIRIFSNILDIEAKRQRKPTGFQYDKPTDEQRRLTKMLNDVKRRLGEVVTDENAQIATYLDSRKTWYRNRISDLRYEMAKRELIVKTKTPGRTDPELDALKAEYDQVRKEHEAIFVKPDLTPEQRLELAERAAERIILKLENDLAQGRKTAGKRPDKLTSDRLEALRTRIIQLKAEQEWAQRHLAPMPDLTSPADIRRWFALDRSIRRIEQQLADQNPFGPGKRVAPVDKPSNQALASKLEDLKLQRKEMKARMRPGKRSPLEQAIYNRMGQLRRQISDYNDRLASRDFAPRRRAEPTDLSSNPEAVKLLLKRDEAVRNFYKALQKDRYEQKTRLEKIAFNIGVTRRAMVNLVSSADLSAPRQGLLALLSLSARLPFAPFKTSKTLATIFWRMIRAAWNRDKAQEYMLELRERPNHTSGADRIAKIEYSDIEAPEFTKGEENARSVFDEWAKLPYWQQGKVIRNIAGAPIKFSSRVVSGSNRAFAVFLNTTRAALFDELLEANFQDRGPTDNELRIIGNWVNVATGRGKMDPRIASGAAQVIWAPKLLASRLQFLLGQPLWGGGALRDSARARRIIAKEYARVLVSGTLLALVASMFDEKKEKSLLSSDIGKIVRGNTRIDLWGGIQQMTVQLARAITGKTKTLKGRTIDLTQRNRYGQGDLYTVLTRFLRTKVRPDIGLGLDILNRGDFRGEPLTVGGVAEDLLVPLPYRDIAALMKDRGFTEAMILTVLNQFGAGVSVYEPNAKTPGRTGENRGQR